MSFGAGVLSKHVFCWVVCFFLGLGWGWPLRILSCLPHPLSVGAGLGNGATHVWHKARFQKCTLGFRWFLTTLMFVLSRFWHSLFALPRLPTSRVTWRWPSLTISSSKGWVFLSLLLFTYFAGFVAKRSEVLEWVLRCRVFDSRCS